MKKCLREYSDEIWLNLNVGLVLHMKVEDIDDDGPFFNGGILTTKKMYLVKHLLWTSATLLTSKGIDVFGQKRHGRSWSSTASESNVENAKSKLQCFGEIFNQES